MQSTSFPLHIELIYTVSGAYRGGGLWGPGPPEVTKGAPKRKKKGKEKKERGEKRGKEGNKTEKREERGSKKEKERKKVKSI